ncbi:MAG: polymerase subunit sigma-24 [Frankiales bacterium]|nr:polymerase subunit sigma-24 [Frankiales bacterium]
MSIDPGEAQDEIVLPPVPLDPVFAEALDDALAGPQVPTSPHDPNRVLGADPHDFAGLYLRHRSSFALHARRFLRDPRDVDEVVQESFLRLFLALPELGSELQALAYCRRTITNLCIDRYRADQRRPRLVDLESVPSDVLSEDELDDPVIQAEDAAIVREALALLSPLHREALVKREIEEKPLPQIAVELGVPEDSVKHLLHRARRALRRRLAETQLKNGVDPDDLSTLSLLARSAVSGSGRLGAFVLILVGLLGVVGTTSRVPAQAIEAVAGLWADDPVKAPVVHVPVVSAPQGAPRQPAGLTGLDRDQPDPFVAPVEPAGPPAAGAGAAAVAPVSGGVPASATVVTSASPVPSPRPALLPTAGPSPRPSDSPLPLLVPRDPSDDPTPTPSATPAGDHLEVQPTAAPSASSDDHPDSGPVRVPVSSRVLP